MVVFIVVWSALVMHLESVFFAMLISTSLPVASPRIRLPSASDHTTLHFTLTSSSVVVVFMTCIYNLLFQLPAHCLRLSAYL